METKTVTTDERRELARHRCDRHVTCTPCVPGSQLHWSGQVLDLSRSGIRVLVERRFEVGSILCILFRDDAGAPLASFLGRVMHVNADSSGKWILGCAIAPQLSDEDLKALLKG